MASASGSTADSNSHEQNYEFDEDDEQWIDLPLPQPADVAAAVAAGYDLLRDDAGLRAAVAAGEAPPAEMQAPGIEVMVRAEARQLDADEVRALRRLQRMQYRAIHMLHLQLLLARQQLVNRACNNEDVQARAMSLLPSRACKPGRNTQRWDIVRDVMGWASKIHISSAAAPLRREEAPPQSPIVIGDSSDDEASQPPTSLRASNPLSEFDLDASAPEADILQQMHAGLRWNQVASQEISVAVFVAAVRSLNIPCRFVQVLRPLGHKVLKKDQFHAGSSTFASSAASSQPQQPQSASKARRKDFATHPQNQPIAAWAEVFMNSQDQWVPVSPLAGHMNQAGKFELEAGGHLLYVVAVEEDGHVRDITAKYASDFMSVGHRQRIDLDWWKETLAPLQTPRGLQLEQDEERAIGQKQISQALPKAITAYKTHALYAIERFLSQSEAVRPGAKVVGYCRGEAVYLRQDVQEVKSAEAWLKLGRVVPPDTQPFKMAPKRRRVSTALPGQGKKAKKMMEDDSDEDDEASILSGIADTAGAAPQVIGADDSSLQKLYGWWQTGEYEPPVASHGRVPTNKHGSVDLFQKHMLPRGTVHLAGRRGISRVAKDLSIHAPDAVVDFEFRSGRMLPVKDGVVVCAEQAETLLEAYEQTMAMQVESERAERRKRARRNWKRAYRRALIFARLERDSRRDK